MTKQIYLTYKEENDNVFLGEYFDEGHFDQIITEDCDIYKPINIEGECELLATFRKGVFSEEVTASAYQGLIGAVGMTDNRGYASGPITEEQNLNLEPGERRFYFDPDEDPDKKLFTRYVIRKDGTKSTTSYGRKVEAGIAGYFDRYVRFPFCRQTSYTRDNLSIFEKAVPFVQEINSKFKELIPDRWGKQNKIASETVDAFLIPETVFTTLTINKNFRTAGHRDAGDFKPGFGNLTIINNDINHMGGYLVFPKFRVAVDVKRGDFLGMDVHEIHGNYPITGPENFQRVSIVCYYRESMNKCEEKQYEDLRKDFYYEYGYKPKMYHSSEWEFTLEKGEVVSGMFESSRYDEWLKNRFGSIDAFL